MTDPFVDARFAEQISADFDDEPVTVGPLIYTRQPQTRIPTKQLKQLWKQQGQPTHRGIILTVGGIWLDVAGWHLHGWEFEGTFCPHVPPLELEMVGGCQLIRAVCGWHLPDLWRAAQVGTADRLRAKDVW